MVAERTPWLVEIERVRVRERETNTRALTIAEWLLFRRAFYFGLRCSNIFVFFWQKFLSLFTFMSNFQLLKYYMVFFIFINRQSRQQQSTRACASLSIKRMFVRHLNCLLSFMIILFFVYTFCQDQDYYKCKNFVFTEKKKKKKKKVLWQVLSYIPYRICYALGRTAGFVL